MASKAKTAIIFGVFDLLHPGHMHVLRQSAAKAKKLIVVVARDSMVLKMKKRMPAWNEKKRITAIKKTGLAYKVIIGDTKQGTYSAIKKYKPDAICLGYDQSELKKDLMKRIKKGSNQLPQITLYTLRSYKPRVFHTSIHRKNDVQ